MTYIVQVKYKGYWADLYRCKLPDHAKYLLASLNEEYRENLHRIVKADNDGHTIGIVL